MTSRADTVSDTNTYEASEAFARAQDEADALRMFRERFHIPRLDDGRETVYLCGNSLGLQPRAARAYVDQELDDWASLAVDAHFRARTPWYTYHEALTAGGERIVGARPDAGEVVFMNSLTVNLHLMLATFYQPTKQRHRILIDWPAFPSDLYAVQSHVVHRGFDPQESLLLVRPDAGSETIPVERIEDLLDAEGESIALVLLSGVNYYTGQVHDMQRITRKAHDVGCLTGFDLAHAAGNVPLRLHDWNVDFACWCSYKYLNGGPGAVAGCFVHERHARNTELPRLAGWWGNDPDTRFRMHLNDQFIPRGAAAGWQLSNPPILAMAPLRASLTLFDEATMDRLRAKSVRLTGFLRFLIGEFAPGQVRIITPAEPSAQGCQLSLVIDDRPRERFTALQREGVVCDFREPNVIRVAPVPLYNLYLDVWRFARSLSSSVT